MRMPKLREGGEAMIELSEFPTQEQLDAMNKDELNELWKRLLDECDIREGAIACRALSIGQAFLKAVER